MTRCGRQEIGCACGDVLGGHVKPCAVDETVAIGALDAEKIDLRGKLDARRKVSLDAHWRDEARPVDRRASIEIRYVGIRVHLALGDRGLTDFLDRARRQRRLVVAEHGACAGQGDRSIDGKDQIGRVAGDLRRHAAFDPHAEDCPITIDDGDDRIVEVCGRGGARAAF